MSSPIILVILWLLLHGWATIPGENHPLSWWSRKAEDFPEPNWARLRHEMVEKQIKSRGISAPAILAAMKKVPRHRFVEPHLAPLAYGDYPLALDYKQTISQPYIVAYLSQAAAISPEAKVLEIGTGSGYQAAVLAELAQAVYTVEIIPELAQQAAETFSELGYTNIQVKADDGYQGWPEYAPYDAIIVTAAAAKIPPPLIEQLKVNGKLVIPIGTWLQDILVVTKTSHGLREEKTIPVRFVPFTRN